MKKLEISTKELISKYIYSTPHKLSTTVFLTVHTTIGSSQASIGNNYLELKLTQFVEHPIATSFEIISPYIIPYVLNTIAKRIN